MSKATICFACGLGFLLWGSAGRAQEQAHAPNIVCDEPTYDFGQLETGTDVEHTYVIRNDGDLTLVIGDVRTSCGCTVANVTTKEVAPGEETQVTARLSLKNRRGKQRKAITVTSNDPDTPQLSLYLEGDATSHVTVEPNKLYLGQIEEDTPVSGVVSITSEGDPPLRISKVESQSELLEASVETIEDGKSYKIHISTKPPLPKGSLYSSVRVMTESATVPVIDISVSGTVLDQLTVAPNQIVLAEKDEAVTRYVVVRPGKTKIFEVQGVEAPVPSMEVHVTQLGENGYQIRLDNVVASKDLDGKELTINTNVAGSEHIKIPFKIISQS